MYHNSIFLYSTDSYFCVIIREFYICALPSYIIL